MIFNSNILIQKIKKAEKRLRVDIVFENGYTSEKGVANIMGMQNSMATGVKVLIPIDGNPNQIISLGEA